MLSQLNPIHTPTSKFLKMYLTIVLPSTPGSSQWSLLIGNIFRKNRSDNQKLVETYT
jgi:hypothetical protein